MILVDGEKYACVQCIRGHRSSTCKHASRPLVQVRSRGRPSLTASHRIAVTETEIVLSRDEVTFQNDLATPESKSSSASSKSEKALLHKKSCCSSKAKPTIKLPEKRNCCSNSRDVCACNNKNGVILLKASKRQFVDVKNGNIDFVGPYNGSSINNFKVDGGRVSKPKYETPHINQLRLLKTMKVNEVSYNQNSNHNYNQNLNQIHNPNINYNITHNQTHSPNPTYNYNNDYNLHNNNNNNNYDPNANNFNSGTGKFVYETPIPGPSTPAIITPPPTFDNQQFTQPLPFNVPNHLNNGITPPHNLPISPQHIPPQGNQGFTQERLHNPDTRVNVNPVMFDMVFASGCADVCHCGPECSCPACLIHRTNEELKAYGILEGSSTTVSTPTEVKLENEDDRKDLTLSNGSLASLRSPEPSEQQSNRQQPNADFLNFETVDELLLQEMLDDGCICAPEDCRCYTCAQHGISEGIRLIDGTRVADSPGPIDLSLMTGQEGYGEGEHDCGCLPEECECYNCVKHGIYNGVRTKAVTGV